MKRVEIVLDILDWEDYLTDEELENSKHKVC